MTISNQSINEATVDIKPFRISIPQADLDELQYRLSRTRWPEALSETGWKYGVSLNYLKELATYWHNEYDWRKHESRLNEYPHFMTTIDGAQIHFMHVRSPEADAFPLLLTHAWPSSIVEFLELIGPLSDPASTGVIRLMPSISSSRLCLGTRADLEVFTFHQVLSCSRRLT